MLPITIVVGQPRFKSGKKKVPFDQAYGHSIALHCMVTCHVFLSLSRNIAMSFCLSTNSQCSKVNNFCGNTNFVLIL